MINDDDDDADDDNDDGDNIFFSLSSLMQLGSTEHTRLGPV